MAEWLLLEVESAACISRWERYGSRYGLIVGQTRLFKHCGNLPNKKALYSKLIVDQCRVQLYCHYSLVHSGLEW